MAKAREARAVGRHSTESRFFQRGDIIRRQPDSRRLRVLLQVFHRAGAGSVSVASGLVEGASRDAVIVGASTVPVLEELTEPPRSFEPMNLARTQADQGEVANSNVSDHAKRPPASLRSLRVDSEANY